MVDLPPDWAVVETGLVAAVLVVTDVGETDFGEGFATAFVEVDLVETAVGGAAFGATGFP